jgi:hypothetical protein
MEEAFSVAFVSADAAASRNAKAATAFEKGFD